MKVKKNRIYIIGLSIIWIIFFIFLYYLDIFTHGFYVENVDIDDIQTNYIKKIDLKEEEFRGKFIPVKDYFAGFQVVLFDLNDQSEGYLDVEIIDSKDNSIERKSIALSKIRNEQWYYLHINKKIYKNRMYTLKIRARDCSSFPSLHMVDPSYLGAENVEGNLLLGYAYSKATFSFEEKIIISFIFIILYLLIVMNIVLDEKIKKLCFKNSIYILLIMILFGNYLLNFIDPLNESFKHFQGDSETLVSGAILADEKGIKTEQWGLGRYMDTLHIFEYYGDEYLTDANWYKGYSLTEPSILISNNDYTREVAKIGNFIEFINGEKFSIVNSIQDNRYLIVKLSYNQPLKYEKYGSLDGVKFFSEYTELLEVGKLAPYISNYGLQGRIFRTIAKIMNYKNVVEKFHIICGLLLSIIVLGIVIIICKKYNFLMAICFYMTFLLSPWIVNFARNLYWLEFTFFLPMLIGLFLSMNYKKQKDRRISYIFIFLSILFKSLCGYEYMSSIMLASIAFLLTDYVILYKNKNLNEAKLLLKIIFIFGLFSVMGFISAICIHAYVRADGDILQGIKNIIMEDVLRRVAGGDLNKLGMVYWDSLNASIWEVLKLYFNFPNSIITGIPGNMFMILCLLSASILIYDIIQKKAFVEKDMFLYIILFITSISWLILAKAHSYVHTHMNFILWYFGYIQMCIYVICKKICEINSIKVLKITI